MPLLPSWSPKACKSLNKPTQLKKRAATTATIVLMASQLPPRASLPSLPQELQDTITCLVANPCKKENDLASLSYTCKVLRATCLPFIYEDISLDAGEERFMGGPAYQPEIALARSLSSSSSGDLGQYIRRLRLHGVDPTLGTIEQILSQTKNLTWFECHFSVFCDLYGDGTCIDTQSLAKALRNVSQTLEQLHITYRFHLDKSRNVEHTFTHKASFLKHMIKLKVLIMPISLLLGWHVEGAPGFDEVIPPGLVNLVLDTEHYWINRNKWVPAQIIKAVNGFVEGEKWRDTTPHLKSITIHDLAWGPRFDDQTSNSKTLRGFVEKADLQYLTSRAGLSLHL
jgi:hypothetical protein